MASQSIHIIACIPLLDKFSEKPLKIMWKVPGIFHCIFMGCYPWISPENFNFQRPWKWETYEIPRKGCKIKPMELPWKTYEINVLKEISEKAMKFISLKWDLWKSCENYCHPTSPIKKPCKIVTLQLPCEKAMKMFTFERAMKILWNSKDHSQRDLKIDNTTVGSTDKSSQLLSFIPWGYFLPTIAQICSGLLHHF